MQKKYILFFLILSFLLKMNGQSTLRFINDSESVVVPFKFVNNLMLIDVTLNEENLVFLVDTGVKRTLLLHSVADLLDLKQAKKIRIKGLGEDKYYDAVNSKSNVLRIKNLISTDFEVILIPNKEIDFSSSLGVDVHGIIGSDLFKNFIVEINYSKKKITLNKPENYTYKKCKRCRTFPLEFNFEKPYINTYIYNESEKILAKLLIDSGSSESVWLFERSSTSISVPNKNFNAFLGKGLSGHINGKKAKLKKMSIGDYHFNNLIVAYPDSISIKNDTTFFKRNGIIGSEILKRFHIVFDYPHKKIRLKKNRRYFKKLFYYDKSGLSIVFNGKMLIKERVSKVEIESNSTNTQQVYTTTYSNTYAFKNSYRIDFVKKNSAADKAGLLENDVLIAINNIATYKLSLNEIVEKLSGRENKLIKLKVLRNLEELQFKFRLVDLL